MLPTDNHLEGEVSLSPAAHLADTGTGSDWENGEGWHCPVLQQLGEGDHLALQHCSSYQWMSMNDARLAMSMQHKYWAMFMFIHNYPNKTLCRQYEEHHLSSSTYHLSLTEYSGESWDQMGYPNSPAGDWGDQGSSILTSEYFDTHNIWIRRLLAKTVMLVNEDLTGNFKIFDNWTNYWWRICIQPFLFQTECVGLWFGD